MHTDHSERKGNRARRSWSSLVIFGSALLLTAALSWIFALTRGTPTLETKALIGLSQHAEWRSLPWQQQNQLRIQRLRDCLTNDSCTHRERQVVLLTSWYFTYALAGGTSGEYIWAKSVLESLDDLGYTYLICDKREQMAPLYRIFPDQTVAVIAHPSWIPECMQDDSCIKSHKHPEGIPLWKILSFEFWRGPWHPLGPNWTLSPEDLNNGNTYLGYSIQRACYKNLYIPHENRKNRAIVLAKRLTYFYQPTYPFNFVGAIKDDTGYAWKNVPMDKRPTANPHVPAGIESLTTGGENLKREQWYAELANTRIMIGIGMPYLSPSPWDALCLGVPFLNPVSAWDAKDPENRTAWRTQHDALQFETEPRVYHVLEVKNATERARLFWEAVGRAASTPLERYISPHKTPEFVRERLHSILQIDWKLKAEQLLHGSHAQGTNVPVRDIFLYRRG
ncbi:hypothetical protein BKA62DRAFT_628481 [Auriculariales sp. MPI-PUGE-AT-0066]|nr:hypothetical protein BKA62DRAFT_628481 [Auriculariales sp. MPI-PUGE-AT-0066]